MTLMEIVNARIEAYLQTLTLERDPVLKSMEEAGNKRNFPIIGPLAGRFLYWLVATTGARRILELGSGFGYSAYWMARGMNDSGEIYLTEFAKENLLEAEEFFQKGRVRPRSHFLMGDSLRLMDDLEGEFDIILNDVDKEYYPEVAEAAPRRLRPGGILVSDNVFWHGKVLEPNPDAATLAILDFNQRINEDPNLITTIVPIRDGLSLSTKRQANES
jgi:caffeoyl-CoA O-methyltransferase